MQEIYITIEVPREGGMSPLIDGSGFHRYDIYENCEINSWMVKWYCSKTNLGELPLKLASVQEKRPSIQKLGRKY